MFAVVSLNIGHGLDIWSWVTLKGHKMIQLKHSVDRMNYCIDMSNSWI